MKHQHETGAVRREPWPRKLVAAVCALGLALLSVPLGVFHAPELAEAAGLPVLASADSWYKGSTARQVITSVTIADSYSPTGTVTEQWDASEAQDGSITAYVLSDSSLVLSGNGSGGIKANENSVQAFYNFINATSISGLDVIDATSIKSMHGMFANCKKVQSLDLSSWSTPKLGVLDGSESYPKANDMRNVFENCAALESIDVSGLDVSNVSTMSYLFSGCEKLEAIDLSSWDTASLVNADWMFAGCAALTAVTGMTGWASGGNLAKVDHLFYNCTSLPSVDLSGWTTGNCTDMNRMFYYDTTLASVDFTGWDTSSCTDFKMMFYECPTLNNLDLSGFDTSSADSLYYFAYNCHSLTNIILGPNFGNASIASTGWVFYVNTSDTTRYPTGYLATRVTGANSIMAFGAYDWGADNRCELSAPVLAANTTWYTQGGTSVTKDSFTTINIVDEYTLTGSELDYWDASAALDGFVMAYVSADGTTLTIAGNGYGSIYTNTDSTSAFADFTNLTTISGLALLDTSNTTDMTNFFEENDALTSVSGIEDWDVSHVVSFNATFHGCPELTSIDISKWDVSSATDMSFFFAGCEKLVDLDEPTTKAVNLTLAPKVFNYCYALPSVDVGFLDSGKLENAGGMFQFCYELVTLTNYEELVTSTTENISYMFNCCYKLPYLDVSQWDTSSADDFQYLFYNTLQITAIDGLENWTTGQVKDMTGTFCACKAPSLDNVSGWDVTGVRSFVNTFGSIADKDLDLSAWATDSAKDMAGMFRRAYDLESVVFGPGFTTPNVTKFSEMFSGCEALKVLDISMFDTSAAANMTDMFKDMYVLQQVSLGSNFTFTGNGSTSCVLPTPDPAYIPGANGKWQAVGTGTVIAPAGTIYDPANVPSFVAETYVMPLVGVDIDVPIKVILALDANGNICTPTATENKIINHTVVGAKVVSAVAEAQGSFQLLDTNALSTTTQANAFGGSIAAGNGAASDLSSISTTGNNWKMAAGSATDASNQIALQLSGAIKNVSSGLLAAPAYVFGITYTFDLDI